MPDFLSDFCGVSPIFFLLFAIMIVAKSEIKRRKGMEKKGTERGLQYNWKIKEREFVGE